MRKLMIKKKVPLIIIFLLCCFVSAASATCRFVNNTKQYLTRIDIPNTIAIPRDAPVGSILFESPDRVFENGEDPTFSCDVDTPTGVKNNVGTTTPGTTSFPIGNTGMSWQWVYKSNARHGYPYSTTPANKSYWFNNTTHHIRIIKTGDITSGAKIPSGVLGFYAVGDLAVIGIKTNESVITSMSCETPDITVEMGGDYKLSDFNLATRTTRRVDFNLILNNCPAGIRSVRYMLKENTAPINESQGIVSLNKSSTAKGVALQLFDANGNPIPLKTPQNFAGYGINGGNFMIPMSASYYRMHSESLEPGTANTEVTFIMTYL
ncbi:fimbrial protein [Pseudomonas sp. zfem004]|uniref:fimbrial protein n=1 Tax=Pseudomonas sp. zfem004 TaxID=3078199 RepID=UPI002927CB72|nr:fimbrial protein [Pseudomonas sp. zfem004]MDU9405146.1 fimbrial protein [Pseudomonas sp. zfem004]